MKITHSISIILAVCLVLITVNYGECGLVLTEGKSYTFEFTSLPYQSDYSEDMFILGQVSLSSPTPIRPQFNFSVYENSIHEPPIRSGINGVDPDFGVQGFGFLEDTTLASWQDLQGIFSIEVLSGTIELESFTAATVIDNRLYQQTFIVPLPNSFIFLLTGILLSLYCSFYKK